MTKKKPVAQTAKQKLTAKQEREFKLFDKLQRNHGYTLLEISRKSERTTLMFDRKKNTMRLAQVVKLVVPGNSAIGQAFAKNRKR